VGGEGLGLGSPASLVDGNEITRCAAARISSSIDCSGLEADNPRDMFHHHGLCAAITAGDASPGLAEHPRHPARLHSQRGLLAQFAGGAGGASSAAMPSLARAFAKWPMRSASTAGGHGNSSTGSNPLYLVTDRPKRGASAIVLFSYRL